MGADGLQHAANLSVPPLADGQIHDRHIVPCASFHDRDIIGSCHAVFEQHTHAKVRHCEVVNDTPHNSPVRLGYPMGWMADGLSERSVIGEEQKPGGVRIESPNRIDPLSRVANELHDRPLGMRIMHARNYAGGLVEREVQQGDMRSDAAAVHADIVGIRVSFRARFCDRAAVNGDAAGNDEILAGPA